MHNQYHYLYARSISFREIENFAKLKIVVWKRNITKYNDNDDDDDDYQAFRAERFLPTDDSGGEEVVGDEADDGEGGDVHEAVVGQLQVGLPLHLHITEQLSVW